MQCYSMCLLLTMVLRTEPVPTPPHTHTAQHMTLEQLATRKGSPAAPTPRGSAGFTAHDLAMAAETMALYSVHPGTEEDRAPGKRGGQGGRSDARSSTQRGVATVTSAGGSLRITAAAPSSVGTASALSHNGSANTGPGAAYTAARGVDDDHNGASQDPVAAAVAARMPRTPHQVESTLDDAAAAGQSAAQKAMSTMERLAVYGGHGERLSKLKHAAGTVTSGDFASYGGAGVDETGKPDRTRALTELGFGPEMGGSERTGAVDEFLAQQRELQDEAETDVIHDGECAKHGIKQ